MTDSTAPAIDLVELTVETARAAMESGAITSEALTQAFLDRIAEYNPKYNAILFMNPDALETARSVDRRRAAGEKLGPLAGIPVVVKDPMDMVGFPSTAGWAQLYSKTGGTDLMPERDSPVVARMKAADTVILGKTNVPVLSHTGADANDSFAGPTLNVAAPDLLPGGSSTGTAAAVAASLAVLGLAEETGGSIQNPASAQGLVGIKPSHALVPNAGVVPLSAHRDVVGPIARCVRDAALCLDVLAGFTTEDPKTIACVGHMPKGGYTSKLSKDALAGKRIGLYGAGWRNQPLSEETVALYTRAQEELKAAGAILVEDPFAGSGFAELRHQTVPGQDFDARGMESVPYDLEQYLKRLGPSAALKTFVEFAEATKADDAFAPGGALHYMTYQRQFAACLANPSLPPDLSDFVAARAAYLEIFGAVFAAHQLDGLCFPQMRTPLAGLHSGGRIDETTVSEINIAGIPGVTVPAGAYASGAPFNLIFVGPKWSEAELLAQAYAYEQATQHRHAPKLL